MLKLLPISIFSVLMAFISHSRSKYSIKTRNYIKKESLAWFIMGVCMVLFVGLRTNYNDTFAYLHAYALMNPHRGLFEDLDWAIGSNPGFNLLNRILLHLGFSGQSYLLFYATVTVSIQLWFIRKYSNNLWLSIFLYITTGAIISPMGAMKQYIAISLSLLGIDSLIKKKKGWFVFWILLGCTFHPYCFMYFIIPFMFYEPWSNKTYTLLGIFAIIGLFLRPLLGPIIRITSMLGESYTENSFAGDGINPFRLAVVAVPAVLSYFIRKEIKNAKDPTVNLFINLSMLNAAIMYIGLFGTANYFGRLANYFSIFRLISLPWIIDHVSVRNRKQLTGFAILFYIIYFIYAFTVNQHFDDGYKSITLLEYLRSLFQGG